MTLDGAEHGVLNIKESHIELFQCSLNQYFIEMTPFIVELEVQSRVLTQVSHTGQKTFLPLGEINGPAVDIKIGHAPLTPPEIL